MKQILSVFNSDAINRYGMKFTISALETALDQSWLMGVPHLISHDIHRPIGWARSLGLYLEPKLARLLGIILIPETKEEQEQVYHNHQMYINNYHTKHCAQYEDKIKRLIDKHLNGKEMCIRRECIALWDKGIAKRVFKSIFQHQDKDGVVPLNYVLQYFLPIGIGVFKSKKSDLVLFVHPYFRKSLSRYNNYNTAFLNQILNMKDKKNFNIKLAFDSDLVGYAPTYEQPIELEFWRGPKFNEDIAKICHGVTVYASTDYQNFFNGISKTEFWWKARDSTRIFEAEELEEIPSFGVGKNQFGCKYVHSMFDISEKAFFHFDGAIRMYSEDGMKDRMEKDIKKAGKHTKYTKLFRIDGELDISEWKSLTSNYFQGNPLVIEYFGGDREPDLEPSVLKDQGNKDIKRTLCSYSINKGKGIRLMISYHPIDEQSSDKKREVVVLDTITIEEKTYKVVEHDIFEVKKALKRIGDDLELPTNVKFLACEDLYLNLPIIRHGKNYLPTNLQNTIKAIELIVDNLSNRNTNHVISFTLAWPTKSKEIRLSILGHVKDIYKWITKFSDSIPLADNQIGQWLEKVGKWLTENYPESKNIPPLAEIVQSTGVLWIQRSTLSQEIKYRPHYSDEHRALMFDLAIPHAEKRLVEAVKNNHIEVASAFFVNKSKCSKCKEEYNGCPHSKFLDSDIYQKMSDFEFALVFWTDRKA